MIISIEKVGPIEYSEYDLSRSLVLVFGNNNIGKSYAMQIVYLVLKYLLEGAIDESRLGYYYYRRTINEKWINLLSEFSRESVEEKQITNDVIDRLNEHLKKVVVPSLIDSFKATFSSYSNMISDDSHIKLISDNYSVDFALKNENVLVEHKSRKPIYLKHTTSGFHKSRELKNRMDVYVLKGIDRKNYLDDALNVLARIEREEILSFYKDFYSQVKGVYYLPASRSGMFIGMSAMSQGLLLMAQNRNRIRKDIHVSSIPEPVADYYTYVSSIRPKIEGRYVRVANAIEKGILDGEIVFDPSKNILLYKQDGTNHYLEMMEASSMVAEISPITAFIKYILGTERDYYWREKKDWNNQKVFLFIEEPEAHLHPSNQVKFMQSLIEMLDGKIGLIVSSHSNYILNKMNNLILEKAIDAKEYQAIIMEKVDQYRSKTRVMPGDEYGIEDQNFLDTSNDLYEEREIALYKLLESDGTIVDDQ